MVIITGQVPTPAIGLDAFQECDTVGITRAHASSTTSSSRTCATSPRR
jgi:thiamine pyrophosphate-dependent acetolactate synthase large subunit-like protein